MISFYNESDIFTYIINRLTKTKFIYFSLTDWSKGQQRFMNFDSDIIRFKAVPFTSVFSKVSDTNPWWND